MMEDYLGLAAHRLERHRVIAFTGPSGAGKSTYLDWLIQRHPSFVDQPITRISDGRPLRWPDLGGVETEWIFVDELLTAGDLFQVVRLVSCGHRVVAASHLPVLAHRLAWPVGVRVFDLGRHTAKLGALLAKTGFEYSHADLQRFASTHGASFTALQLVLDECPAHEQRLGAALNHFERYCTVRTVREPC